MQRKIQQFAENQIWTRFWMDATVIVRYSYFTGTKICFRKHKKPKYGAYNLNSEPNRIKNEKIFGFNWARNKK